MTDRYIFNAANGVPATMAARLAELDVAGDMTAEAVAIKLGISKKWAYALLRQRNAAEIASDIATIPTKQRDQVLLTIYRHASTNIHDLTNDLHKDGIGLDGHDATKTIWSLAGTGHVRFRERQTPRTLYAIKLTEKGKAAARTLNGIATAVPEPTIDDDVLTDDLTATWKADDVLTDDLAATWKALDLPVVETPEADKEALLTAVTEATPAQIEEVFSDLIDRPWPQGDLYGWPEIRVVYERALKARKLAAAALLLEEAGEDEMALTLMGKTEFNPLEMEVVRLLKHLGELE